MSALLLAGVRIATALWALARVSYYRARGWIEWRRCQCHRGKYRCRFHPHGTVTEGWHNLLPPRTSSITLTIHGDADELTRALTVARDQIARADRGRGS